MGVKPERPVLNLSSKASDGKSSLCHLGNKDWESFMLQVTCECQEVLGTLGECRKLGLWPQGLLTNYGGIFFTIT